MQPLRPPPIPTPQACMQRFLRAMGATNWRWVPNPPGVYPTFGGVEFDFEGQHYISRFENGRFSEPVIMIEGEKADDRVIHTFRITQAERLEN